MSIKTNGNDNVSSGRDTYINYKGEGEQEEFGVIQDIFDNVLEKVKNSKDSDTESSKARDKLIHIKDKIELNFKDLDDRNEVKDYFTQLYAKIFFVEKTFQTLDTEEQNEIHFYILNNYKRLKRSSEGFKQIDILQKLTLAFIPRNQFKNPTYLSIAQAIVLFFFDDCTIFEKTKVEPKQINLFDDL